MTTWDIELPLAITRRGQTTPGPPLTANQRLHHMQRAKLVRYVRTAAEIHAKNSIPPQPRIDVQLHYAPGSVRGGRFDPSNLMPTQKAALDGVVRAGVVPDDHAGFVTEHMPVVHNGPGKRRLWLRITTTTEERIP